MVEKCVRKEETLVEAEAALPEAGCFFRQGATPPASGASRAKGRRRAAKATGGHHARASQDQRPGISTAPGSTTASAGAPSGRGAPRRGRRGWAPPRRCG